MGRMSFLTISTRSSTTVKQLIEKPLQTSAWNVAIQPAVGSFYPALPPVPFASAGHRIKLEISISCVAIDNLLPRTTFCPLSVIFIPSSITAFSGLLSLSLTRQLLIHFFFVFAASSSAFHAPVTFALSAACKHIAAGAMCFPVFLRSSFLFNRHLAQRLGLQLVLRLPLLLPFLLLLLMLFLFRMLSRCIDRRPTDTDTAGRAWTAAIAGE